MKNIEWLLHGNPVIQRLTKKYLLEQDVSTIQDGFIKDYLSLYNSENHQWGNGYYSPKWISSHYTLMELTYMEMDGLHPIYQEALQALINHLWSSYQNPPKQYLDMCIAGMIVQMACHAEYDIHNLRELIDYILEHKMVDGGWNCMKLRSGNPKISSVHTTLTVLEAFDMYESSGYKYRIEDIRKGIQSGIECLLERRLIYKKGTKVPINQHMVRHHYPARWKYDYLRVLEFLAKRHYPLCDEMMPAMVLLKSKLKHGRLTKGTQIAGQTHFRLETESYGYFNTLRAYKVLKEYEPLLYEQLIHMNEI